MLFLLTIGGVIVYILTRWSVEFNATQEDGKTWAQWKHWAFTEINEWVMALVGAIVFFISGDGIYYGIIEAFGLDYDKWMSVFVEMEKTYYIFGGSLGGTLMLLAFKAIVNKAKKKVEEI